jgi:hypothetical protein
MKRIVWVLVCCCIIALQGVSAQSAKKTDAYVDKSGILRWKFDNREVCAFGVNYTAMFAHAYRTAKRMNVDLEKAIRDDVYHFSRLGFDAFRVHVWDTEISDSVGNLLNNEHLKLFDYALKEMKGRGMKFILTPIAYWGNGYPEPDDKTPGFARKYGKDACLTNPAAIVAQENYLRQFVEHVNPYTGVAYKNDPDIIAFEVSNEPHHRESAAEVTAFINKMVASMRKTGCAKPIFYNVSHSVHLAEAYFKSNIQGGTFQWYPSGLGARRELEGNFLPNVDEYKITFENAAGYNKMAKIVYEFDAADIGRSYIYPVMARAFREAGMQFASHFAYDPTYMAPFNTEYNTHYMNLAYAPQKALSLKIASEVFHEVPLKKDFGSYPENARFGSFRVSYEEDLAEMVTAKKFFYTNNTATAAPTAQLEQIAGAGSSPVVAYDGTGAYFLDKIGSGVWRLEVMPDAVWVRDPFTKASPHSEMAIVKWEERKMSISLPDLGEGFNARPVNEGNTHQPKVNGKTLAVRPGVYLLTRAGTLSNAKPEDRWGVISLGEFAAPPMAASALHVWHESPRQALEGTELRLQATVVTPGNATPAVEVFVASARGRPQQLKMERKTGYVYEASIPAASVQAGYLQYYISVTGSEGTYTYPGKVHGKPVAWDFEGTDPYRVPVIAKGAPVYLFHAAQDASTMTRPWLRTSSVIPGDDPSEALLQVSVGKLFVPDPENTNRTPIHDYSFRNYAGDRIAAHAGDIAAKKKLVVRGKSLNGHDTKMQVALVLKDGSAFGGVISLPQGELGEAELLLSDLVRVKQVTLPRPYPTFLQYYYEGSTASKFDLNEIESVQFSIGPGLSVEELEREQGVAIESVRLE